MMMMKQQDMFGCNNITEINQIVLDHLNPSISSSMYQQQHEDQFIINSYDDLHFPHPFLDDDDDVFLSHFLSQQQQLFEEEEKHDEVDETTTARKTTTTTTKKKKKVCGNYRKNGRSCTTRRGKKDRHSKIYTAQGPRDRRMRLSLQIARKFFDLQDMLGFDKASKTIEWLLLNSNSAIKDLKQTYFTNNSGVSHGSVYSGQSSEIVSEINNQDQDQEQEEAGGFTGSFKDKKGRQLRIVDREARDRARARARQRTLLKNTSSILHPPINFDHHLSGNSNNNNTDNNTYLDYPTFSCPNSIFLPSPLPLPYSFSDSTLLKLP